MNTAPPCRIGGKWLALAAVSMGTFMATIALNVVNIGLPAITVALRTHMGISQWVLISYLFTTSALLINFGKLGDIFGRSRVYVTGLALFSVTSGICGLSQSIYQLIAFRVLQAVGGAMIIGNGTGLVVESFPAAERGKALGLYTALIGAFLTIGPSLGGFLIEAFNWRFIFLINVPLGIIGVSMALCFLARSGGAKGAKIDLMGGILLPLFLLSFLLGLHFGQRQGWSSPQMPWCFAAFMVFLSLFIAVELKSPHAMLDLRIFRNRVFTAGQISNFINHLSVFALLFIMPFYLVDIMHFSEATAGLIITPVTLGMIIVSPASGWLSDRVGTGVMGTIGFALICAGLFSLSALRADSTAFGIVLRLSILGVGRGIFSTPNNSAIMGAVRTDQYGIAGAMTANLRHLGNVTGVAIMGAMFVRKKLLYLSEITQTGQVSSAAATQKAFIMALHDVLILAALISLVGLLAATVTAKALDRSIS